MPHAGRRIAFVKQAVFGGFAAFREPRFPTLGKYRTVAREASREDSSGQQL